MKDKTLVIIISAISVLTTILCIIGIIETNMIYYIIALILTCINLPIVYKKREILDEFFSKKGEKVIEDERTKLIEAKASNIAYGIDTVLIINIIVVILILRNIYPNLVPLAMILIIVKVISLISFTIGKKYYS